MARVARYTAELVARHVGAGRWTPEYPVDFWRRNARERAGDTAVVAPDGRYTWAEAVERIERIAAGLVADGWKKDERLALQAPNSAALLFLRLACEAAGVVSILVPATFSRSEVEGIERTLAPRGVAVAPGPGGAGLLAHYRRAAVRYTLGEVPLPGTRPLPSAAARHSGTAFGPWEYAAITTTSGTTGAPRFVEHAACARLAAGREYLRRLAIGPGDAICAFTSIFSGNCDLVAYHAAPQAGARVLLVDAFDPGSACALIERERATGAVFVPTLLHRLLAWPGLAGRDLSSLRFVTSFGAMLAPEVAAEVERRLGARVIQGYGASEYGALASTAIDDPEAVRLRGVGRPLPGTELDIRDAEGRPSPPGTVGRLHARGPYCVGGFVDDPQITDDAWRDGYLALGDLGRVDPDGYLWLEGRARDLIIRGGQNISPLEVEDALLAHPSVSEVAVVGAPDAEMGERVCAFVVPSAHEVPRLDALRDFMLERGLARFKLPERLELVARLPMNPAGTKIDKRALAARLADGAGHAQRRSLP